MNGDKTISIIIPLYNKEYSICAAVRSVLDQTYRDFELIVVDDGSTDGSLMKIQTIQDHRIRIFSQKNGGVSAARNTGIDIAKGKYVAFLDADDEWDIDYLETQINLIRNYPQCNVFATNYRFRDRFGTLSETIINNLHFSDDTAVLDNYFEIASTSHVPIWTSAVVILKDAIKRIGCFPIGVGSGEDLITWAKLAVQNDIAYCRIPKATYFLGEGYDYSKLPPRRQDSGDPVGKALSELLKKYPNTLCLKDYISHWHKMRASVAIRFGEKKETIIEAIKALAYNPLNYRVIPFVLLTLFPQKIRTKIIGLKTSC